MTASRSFSAAGRAIQSGRRKRERQGGAPFSPHWRSRVRRLSRCAAGTAPGDSSRGSSGRCITMREESARRFGELHEDRCLQRHPAACAVLGIRLPAGRPGKIGTAGACRRHAAGNLPACQIAGLRNEKALENINVFKGFLWLRGQDLNLRPSGYEPDELPDCSTPRQRVRPRHRLKRDGPGRWVGLAATCSPAP